MPRASVSTAATKNPGVFLTWRITCPAARRGRSSDKAMDTNLPSRRPPGASTGTDGHVADFVNVASCFPQQQVLTEPYVTKLASRRT
jgi:hypothetical protein